MAYNNLDGKIYMFGGTEATDDLWVYDYPTNSWTEIIMNNSPGHRNGHGMIYDSYNNKLLVYRGGDRDLWADDFNTNYWNFLTAATDPTGD